jgi:hypothetical protein
MEARLLSEKANLLDWPGCSVASEVTPREVGIRMNAKLGNIGPEILMPAGPPLTLLLPMAMKAKIG